MSESSMPPPRLADPTLVRTLWLAGAEWVALIFFSMLVLDGGRFHKMTLICVLAYVVGVGLFVARRGSERPSRGRRAVLLASPVALLILGVFLMSWIVDRV